MSTKKVTSDDFYYGRSLTDGNKDEWDLMDDWLTKLGVEFETKYISSPDDKEPFGKAWRMKRKEAAKLPLDLDPEEPALCVEYWGKPEAPFIPVEDLNSGHGIYPLIRDPFDFGGDCIISDWRPCSIINRK
ncbi:MAG: hypothetical protein HC836_35615 [Richelia sp. RM2_1_2]|nr:hypothetical protein [Richelia sp. RM2_1_2]